MEKEDSKKRLERLPFRHHLGFSSYGIVPLVGPKLVFVCTRDLAKQAHFSIASAHANGLPMLMFSPQRCERWTSSKGPTLLKMMVLLTHFPEGADMVVVPSGMELYRDFILKDVFYQNIPVILLNNTPETKQTKEDLLKEYNIILRPKDLFYEIADFKSEDLINKLKEEHLFRESHRKT